MDAFTQTIKGYLESYYEDQDLTHNKCDLDSTYCYAEQYGDGDASEHEEIRSLKADLDRFSQLLIVSPEQRTALVQLHGAALAVVESWEDGDLALAVNELDGAADSVEKAFGFLRQTLEQFIEELEPCDDIGAALQDDALMGTKGLLFRNALYIEDTSGWPTDAPGYGKGRWYTMVNQSQYQSDDLAVVAKPLYEFAEGKGVSNDLARSHP